MPRRRGYVEEKAFPGRRGLRPRVSENLRDPDAPTVGLGWTHWQVANIPPSHNDSPGRTEISFRSWGLCATCSFIGRQRYCDRNPNTATPFFAPTYTLPFAIIGVMNLLPAPNWSRPPASTLL